MTRHRLHFKWEHAVWVEFTNVTLLTFQIEDEVVERASLRERELRHSKRRTNHSSLKRTGYVRGGDEPFVATYHDSRNGLVVELEIHDEPSERQDTVVARNIL